jgi:tetratricopeptide (TPR) repeat protein
MKRQDWIEARDVLEQLHDHNRAAAQDGLVHVLMALADVATGEDEQLALLEQVLSMKRHPAAETAQKQIWTKRGNRARTDGQLKEAITAYRNAGAAQLERQTIEDLRRRTVEAATQDEARGEYAVAYDKLAELAKELPILKDLEDKLARLEPVAYLDRAYRQAIDALERGERESAKRALLEVINRDPGYRDALVRLQALVGGTHTKDDQTTIKRNLPWFTAVLLAFVVPYVGFLAGAVSLRDARNVIDYIQFIGITIIFFLTYRYDRSPPIERRDSDGESCERAVDQVRDYWRNSG